MAQSHHMHFVWGQGLPRHPIQGLHGQGLGRGRATLGAVKKYHQIFQGLAMAGSAGWLKKCLPSKWLEGFFMVSVLSAEVDNTTKAKPTSL